MWFRRKRRRTVTVRLPKTIRLPKADPTAIGRLAASVRLPKVRIPEEILLPDVTVPSLVLGEVKRQEVQLPAITLPRIHRGEVAFGDVDLGWMGRGRRRVRRTFRFIGLGLFAAAVWQEMSRPEAERQWHGRVLGVPYDFRPPTKARFRDAWWNEKAGLITPAPWGMGWTLNFHQLWVLAQRDQRVRRTVEHLPMVHQEEPVSAPHS